MILPPIHREWNFPCDIAQRPPHGEWNSLCAHNAWSCDINPCPPPPRKWNIPLIPVLPLYTGHGPSPVILTSASSRECTIPCDADQCSPQDNGPSLVILTRAPPPQEWTIPCDTDQCPPLHSAHAWDVGAGQPHPMTCAPRAILPARARCSPCHATP